ncbi:hypothetical protein DPMN_171060 [Dreissena polymorpha]|uniref:Uncharacterized protein n=1 Tax=Dreissena polymorpha TaxID=45954 RepID=A0A9D4E0J7_DREPO|nr:hypothetical protein DPMN_171060 [Dreissena polymorpha]
MWPHKSISGKNAPPLGGHVFQANVTIFELIQDIIETKLLTKFHEDLTINVASRLLTRKNAQPPGGHVCQATETMFELFQDIIGMNLLTKFHEDRTINVACRVLTRFYYSHVRKNAPPLGSHVFQANVTIFELIQDIIVTNLLTKFHEDWTKMQMLTPHNGRRTKGDHKRSNSKKSNNNEDTDQQTDQQTGQKQYVPHYYINAQSYNYKSTVVTGLNIHYIDENEELVSQE